MYTNTDTLINKLSELELLIKEQNYDIVAVTEVLPKNVNHDIENFVLEGFTCITVTQGRGVCLFVKEGIDVFRLSEVEANFNPCIVCKLILPNKESFIFGVVYRSPSSEMVDNQRLNSLLNTLFSVYSNERIFLTGDFNYPEINWDEEVCNKGADHPASMFLDTVQQNYLFQHVTEPTHYRALQHPNILDLILTNEQDLMGGIEYFPPLGKSHHPVLDFKLHLEHKPYSGPLNEKYNFGKGDYDAMREFMSVVPWSELLSDSFSVDKCWANINTVVHEAMDKFVPRVKLNKFSGKGRRDPIPTTVLDKIRLKRRHFKMYKKYPTRENYNAYAKARNQVKWETRKLVTSREKRLAEQAKTNPKCFYQYVSAKTKPKETVSNLIKDDGSLTQSDTEKADVLNSFFGSVFTSESDGDVPVFDCGQTLDTNTVVVSEQQMCKALQALKVNKSPGPDEISPRVLRELASELSFPLTVLFRRTMSEGKIPIDWKEAEVKPLFKKGDKSSASNYRPVSLTSVVCKVFEGFVRDQLCDHLVKNGLLSDDQFGFTKGRSCVTQLLVTVNEWMSALDDGLSVDAVYMDLKKAFDTVPHLRLISKLKGYGIKGELLQWISDFLKDRTQYVTVNGNSSERIRVTSGVPQGSVVGPSLFIYFINDMPAQVECKTKIFADDTKAYAIVDENTESRDLIQRCIDRLVEWTNKWLLEFNSQKCKVVHLGKNNPQHQYEMRDRDGVRGLEASQAERDLGVIIDPSLNFETHINETVKKGNRLAGLLVRTITNKSTDIMVPLYKALIRPVLEYGNPVWCPFLRKHIDLLEGVQRRFTKKIINMSNLEYSERMESLRLPSLEYRRLRGDLIEVFKIVHQYYDLVTTSSLFTFSNNDITRGHNFKLTKTFSKTRQYQQFFTNRVVTTWNNLPTEAVNATSLNAFKNQIDKYFKDIMYSTNLEIRKF